MILLVLGPQGSGKGTQAKRLADEFGLFYFDAGAFLRKIAKTNPKIDEIVNKRGLLVPDGEMFGIVRDALGDKVDNLVLDGYPRSVSQFELLSKWLSERGRRVTKAIYLKVGERESVRRLSGRRIDPQTGKVYNLLTNKPGPEVDETRLIQREDDRPEAILERLAIYRSTTEPLIKKLREDGILVEVDGEKSIDEVYAEIKKIVEEIK